jgi:hypothetical protein
MIGGVTERLHAPIVKTGGVLVLKEFLDRTWFDALKVECDAQHATAKIQVKETEAEFHSSDPGRNYLSANGGSVQTTIYHDAILHRALTKFCGHPVRPTGDQGTYSYYECAGHFLGLHRDVPRCDLTMITCLRRESEEDTSGALRLYYKSLQQPLTEIHSGTKFHDIHINFGQTLLLLGGCVPHEVLACGPDFKRYISVLCFEIL